MPAIRTDAEHTGAQVITAASSDTLPKKLPATYKAYRTLRKDPTVALARALTIAPIVAGEWMVQSVYGTDPARVDFIRDMFVPIREPLLQAALENGCDFGWAAFEKVFAYDSEKRLIIKKFKPLLVDLTTILVDEETGAFEGFRQKDIKGNDLDLDLPYCLLVPWRMEGTNWYGEPTLENVRDTQNKYILADDAAARFDRKVAGAHWVIKYPEGKSKDGVGGALTDNATIAERILTTLKASGSVAIPIRVVEQLDTLNEQIAVPRWSVELIAAPASQASFVERENYLDKLKVRGLIMPERAILEGQFGTKAEAGAHQDLAVTQRDLEHRHVTRLINWHAVDQVLAENYGEEARGTVWLQPAPLADEAVAWLREVYRAVLANPMEFITEIGNVDMDALRESVKVPTPNLRIKPSSVSFIPEPEPPAPAEPPAPSSNGQLERIAASVAASFNRAIGGGE